VLARSRLTRVRARQTVSVARRPLFLGAIVAASPEANERYGDVSLTLIVVAGAIAPPPIAELNDTDLTAHRWTEQPEVEWIMLISSLLSGSEDPTVPVTLSWVSHPPPRPVVRHFVESSLETELPVGWLLPQATRSS
jgi:hypothetical protein